MKWSFDDLHIGKTSTGISLTERIIPRPNGLSNDDWYKFAGQIIVLLNEPKDVKLREAVETLCCQRLKIESALIANNLTGCIKRLRDVSDLVGM